MIIDYDKNADVLYITFRQSNKNDHVSYIERPNGVILRANVDTSEVICITIPFLSREEKVELLKLEGTITYE